MVFRAARNIQTLFALISMVSYCGDAKLPFEFMADFLSGKNLNFVVLLPCTDTDFVEWLKYTSASNFGFLNFRGGISIGKNGQELHVFNDSRIYPSNIQIGIVVHLDCAVNEELLGMVPRKLLSTSQYQWLILTTAKNEPEVDLTYKVVPLTFESDFTIATIQDNTTILLTDAYKFNRSGKVNTTLAGIWQGGSGLRWFWTQSSRDRRLNMHGFEVTAAIVFIRLHNISTEDPNIWLDPDYLKGQDGLTRHAYELWTYLADLHNLRINITANMNSYGGSNGSSFDGMVGVLQRQEAEVGLVAVVMTKERQAAIDYVRVLRSFWGWRPMFVFLHPKTSSKVTALIDAVSMDAWVGIALVSVLLSLVLCVSYSLPSNLVEQIVYCMTFVAAVVAQQGLGQLSQVRRLSIRIMVVSALFFGFILVFFYNATILTFLLSAPPKTIRTLRHLIDSSLQMISENAVQFVDFYLRNDIANAKEVYEKKIQSPTNFLPFVTGMNKLRKEPLAFMSDDQKIFRFMQENFTEAETCAAQVIDLLPINFPFTMPVQKGSPFGEVLARGFLLLLERGIVNRVDHRWKYTQPACIASDYTPVENEDVFFAYLVISVGFLTSFVLFLVEVVSVQELPPRWRKFIISEGMGKTARPRAPNLQYLN